jgi:Lrp/AsnC family leucine-responsive transcriptional regulator
MLEMRAIICAYGKHLQYLHYIRKVNWKECKGGKMAESEKDRLLDALGWKILDELQRDARLSYAELGRRVGLSTPAVAQRVQRMEDEGIIRAYRAEIDPAKIGLSITAFIRMSIVGNVLARLTERVRSMPEIVECYRGTGEDSFILKVNVVSVEHLKDVIDRLTPFGTTSTSLVLSSIIERNLMGPANLSWPETPQPGLRVW